MFPEFFYRNNRSTRLLEDDVKKCKNYEEFEEKFSAEFLNGDTQLSDYLDYLLFKYNQRASVVSDKAGKSFSYLGHVINGRRKNPSRDFLLAICFVVGATFEEASYLLKYAGHLPLYVRRKRDVIIWFALNKRMSIDEVNKTLANKGFATLFDDK